MDADDLQRSGLSDVPPAELGGEVLAAWDAFLEVVTDPRIDLARPSRLRGWSGLNTCVHLGSWPDAQVLDGLLASAHAGGTGPPVATDAGNATLVAAHAHETPERVVQALREARDRLARAEDRRRRDVRRRQRGRADPRPAAPAALAARRPEPSGDPARG